MKKLFLTNSLGFQLFFGILGMFFILIFSTAYILLSTIKMQELVDKSFQQERFIKSIQESLLEYQGPLNQYLATRSSDALAEHLIISQKLRNSLPHIDSPPLAKSELREKEVYALIRAYLNLADRAVEQKRGRNTSGFALLYEEMTDLLEYIQAEIASISVERFQSQLGIYSQHIENSRNLQLRNFLFVLSSSLLAILLVLRSLQKITRPMSSLSTMAKELASGNFEQEDISASSIYEIDQVVEAFNRMKTEIHQSIIEIHHQENIKQDYMRERVKNFRMEALLRRMEIYTLQAQMNPHFLFNTLNTGMQLAILEKADRTEEFMDQLSKLLRYLDEALTRLTLKSTAENDPSHLFKVGEYYVRQNQYNQAFYAFDRYLLYCPNGPNVALAKERMQKIKAYTKNLIINRPADEFNRSYTKDNMIFSEGEPGQELYIIQRGAVKITKIVDNNEVLLAVLKQGDIFGEMALLESKPRSASAIAYDDCILLAVSKANFARMVSSQPQIISRLTQLLAERIWFIYKQLANTLITDPLGRMYDAMLMQLEKNRVPIGNNPYTFDFGPKELVNMVGLPAVEGNLVLRKLMENQKIRLLEGKIALVDTNEIVKQTEYYRKMQKIEKARREAAFRM
jgi:CRP-like cAMP-binding protein/methyl-accepting chemotaxis protein